MGVKVEAEEVWPCQVSIAACLHHCFYCVMQEQCSGAILFLAFDIFVYFLCWFDHFVFAFHRLWRKAAGQTANLQGLDQRWRRLVSARQGYPGYCTKVAKGCQWFNGWLANSILKSRKHLCYLPIECHDVHGVRR